MAGHEVVQAIEGAAAVRRALGLSGSFGQPGTQAQEARPVARESDAVGETARKIAAAVDHLNEVARIFNTRLHFIVLPGHEIVVEVIDEETGEIIRRIPPGPILEAEAKMQAALGVLFDEKA
ncbi:MAG TPA: flagellar protein FlaG [Limnochordia bacterium]